MKKTLLILLLVMAFAPFQVHASSGWTGNVNFTLGAKVLDESDWEPVDQQGEIGIDVDFRRVEWPVNMVIALKASASDDDVDGIHFDASTGELRFGVRKIWAPTSTMCPYFGGGLALIGASLEGRYRGSVASDSDSEVGFWIDGGIFWTIAGSFNIGFNFGYSKAEVTLFGVDGEAGGGHSALILGYHW